MANHQRGGLVFRTQIIEHLNGIQKAVGLNSP